MEHMPSVLITGDIPEPGVKVLKNAGFEVQQILGRTPTREDIIAGLAGKDALLCLLSDTIDGAVMDAAPSLRIIANYAVGYNNIDIPAATGRGILVTNTPDVLTETTADLAFALMLAAARRVAEGDRMVRAGEFREWAPKLMLGTDVWGKTLGIVGMGKIGTAVARRARGFNMKLLYHNRSPNPEAEAELGAKYVDFQALLAESDFISVHTPLTPETTHMFGKAQFAAMKKGAFFINTSRGPVADEGALVDALASGHLGGAGLDVYENEPQVHPGLLRLENAVLTPHVGSASTETRGKMAVMAAQSIVDWLGGKRPQHVVNGEVANRK